jgi:hypothetical protein
MSTIKIQTLLLIAFFLSLPFALLSQDSNAKEKKVTVKIVKGDNGEITVVDTTFTVSSDEDLDKIVKQYTLDSETDTSGNTMIDVMVDMDKDLEWTDENGKNVIIMKSPGSKKKVYRFKWGEEGNDDHVIVVGPNGKHKVVKWVGKDGEDYNFDYDYDFEVDMDPFNEQMDKQREHLEKLRIEILDDEGKLHKELAELHNLKDLEELKELEDLEFHVLPPRPPKQPAPFMFLGKEHSNAVSDVELRDAGIKNKPDRLEIDDIDIENEDGVIDLTFSLKQEGTPKLTVYNVYGDKVFNDKPEMMNNKYHQNIDLSKKQHGTYYLMIVSGNSSKTFRIHN